MNAAILALFFFAQSQDRVFEFKQVASDQNLFEITTAIRSITGISALMADAGKKSITVKGGDDDRMALAAWIAKTLDVKPGQGSGVTSSDYKFTGSGEESDIRIFFLGSGENAKSLSALAVKVRVMTGMPRLVTVSGQQAIVLRGSPEQIAHATRLIQPNGQ